MRLQLSPGISYYIRKLLRQNLDRLKFDNQQGAGIQADATSDLNVVLSSLYDNEQRANSVVDELERLALVHQSLSGQGARNRPELQKTEDKIFSLLHLKPFDGNHKGTVLIVDDVQSNLTLLSAALKRQGYDIHTALSGKEAMASIQNAIPDVVLLDIMMPDMDGYAVCEYLRNYTLTQDIPVIFVSAIHDASSKVKAFGLGGSDYITKPFQIEEVLVRVDNQLKIRSLQKRLENQNVRLQDELTERRQMEERYLSLFERSNEGMFQSSPEGRFLKVNRALANLYKYASCEDLIAAMTDISTQLYVQPDRRQELVQQLRQQGHILGVTSEVYCQDGSTLWITENIYAVRNARGKILYYEGTVHSVECSQAMSVPQLQLS
ncbi:response regulator [Alkalinema pantanalense CENA528]|uniref:response regulator n=1 Tax=Alkalinema pantanalense TaxID=1620705 RepID=UPI003D6DDB2B